MDRAVRFAKEQKILLFTILLIVVMTCVNQVFITGNNITGLLISLPAYGMAALGLCISLICGELNISMGSIMAFASVLFAMLVPTVGIVIAILIVLALCAVWGVFGGFFVAVCKIDSFVVTLALMTLIRGVALALSNQQPIVITDARIANFGLMKVGPVPVMTIIFIVFVLSTEYVLKFTVFGRKLYQVGANKEISRSLGINVVHSKLMAFIIYSVYAGVGGLLLAARMNTGSPTVGSDAPLSIIPMVIIGGTALSGGKGGAIKTLLGVFLLQLVFNCMNLYSISKEMQLLVKGLIVLIIVVWDKYSANKGKKV